MVRIWQRGVRHLVEKDQEDWAMVATMHGYLVRERACSDASIAALAISN